MSARFIPLKRPDTCVACTSPITAGTRAWWDPRTRHVTCTRCRPAPTAEPQPLPPPQPIVVGVAGASAASEHDRRLKNHARKHGDAPAPNSVTAWGKGSDGEALLGAFLDEHLDEPAVVLHDRKVPGTRGNIDHIVIAPSGVWVVDAKNYSGLVDIRNDGGIFRPRHRLVVKGRQQDNLVEGMTWQRDHVQAILTPMGFVRTPLVSVVCFTNSEWPRRCKGFNVDGVDIVWPELLVHLVSRETRISPEAVHAIATELSTKLPASAASAPRRPAPPSRPA